MKTERTAIFLGTILYVAKYFTQFKLKKGHLKLSSQAKDNVLNAVTQLKTALETTIKDARTRKIYKPDYVILAASGDINKAAQTHIVENIQDTRILFRDADSLIFDIDKYMPEIWWGIDAKKIPYLKSLRSYLMDRTDTISAAISSNQSLMCPITDEAFTQLYLHKYGTVPKKSHGKITSELSIDEFPVEKIIERQEQICLITGEAGSGKTTTLRRIAIVLIERGLGSSDSGYILILLSALQILNSSGKLMDLLFETAMKISGDTVSPFGVDELSKGLVVLLIDGLDEIANQSQRDTILDSIIEFRDSYVSCRVIIASRDYSFIPFLVDKRKITRFSISPISFRQAGKMVEKLSKGQSLGKEASQEILRRLENVHGMELNPLLVTVFVATSDFSRSDIPANITEIFKKFTEMMLGRWDISKGLSQQYQAPLKDFLLCKLAYTMHCNKVTVIDREKCNDLFKNELAERGQEANLEVLSDEIINRSGLLKSDDDQISFRHHLLQEFFAGRSIRSIEVLKTLCADEWWARPLVFYFGNSPDDLSGIEILRIATENLNTEDRLKAVISLGLSIQACYLVKTVDKIRLLHWLLSAMAELSYGIVAGSESPANTPIMRLLSHYIYLTRLKLMGVGSSRSGG